MPEDEVRTTAMYTELVTAPDLKTLGHAVAEATKRVIESGNRPTSVSHALDQTADPEHRWSAIVMGVPFDL